MTKIYSPEELNSFSRETLVAVILSMQDQLAQLNTNMERLIEQIASANNHRYGRSSEKLDVIAGQLELELIFNEAEALTETLYVVEPAEEDVIQVTRRKKSCRRPLALLAGSSFRMKSIKESGYNRQSIQSKNTMWPCVCWKGQPDDCENGPAEGTAPKQHPDALPGCKYSECKVCQRTPLISDHSGIPAQ